METLHKPNITRCITIDPGLKGAVAYWAVSEAGLFILERVEPVKVIKEPHYWPTKAVVAQEEKMLASVASGIQITATKSKEVLKDRKEAYRPAYGNRVQIHTFTTEAVECGPRTLVVCERPAQGQAGRTQAASIASTAASETALTGIALLHGHPVILVSPPQWQTDMLDPSTSLDSKIQATCALMKIQPQYLERCIRNKSGVYHDGQVDAILLGLWIEARLATIIAKLSDEAQFRYPFPKTQIPKIYGA